MLLEPDERDADPGALRRRLATQGRHGSFDLVAADPQTPEPELVGWLAVEVLPWRRAAHVGTVVLGADAEHHGRGLGGALLEACHGEAVRRGPGRPELTVMVDNLCAVGLYLRHGYQVEGLRRGALLRDQGYVDEYFMVRPVGR